MKQLPTRRDAIRIGFGIPIALSARLAWAAPAGEFWERKPAAEWSSEEVKQLLNRSPWAREASVSYNGGPGNLGGRVASPGIQGVPATGGRSRGRAQTRTGAAPRGSAGDSELPLNATVIRWESALPIREATRTSAPGAAPEYYILALIGDLPSMGRREPSEDVDDDAQYQQRFEMLRQYTKLEHGGDPIFLAKAEVTPKSYKFGSGTLFYFPRTDSILPGDKQATFVTKMGPYEVKARFSLKDMLYHGRLEL